MIHFKRKTMYVQIKNIRGHYEFFINNSFYCSCDTNELKETKEEIKETFKNCEVNFIQ